MLVVLANTPSASSCPAIVDVKLSMKHKEYRTFLSLIRFFCHMADPVQSTIFCINVHSQSIGQRVNRILVRISILTFVLLKIGVFARSI